MVLRLAGLLTGVSSRAKLATSSLPRVMLLDCAERGPVDRNARRLEGATAATGRCRQRRASRAAGRVSSDDERASER